MADTILSLEMDAENARSFVQDVDGWSPQVLTRYVRFCTDSAEALTLLLHPQEIDRAILGETHWRIRGLESGPTPGLYESIDLELRTCIRRLRALRLAIGDEIRRWQPDPDAVLVPDTNVLIHSTTASLAETDWHLLSGLAPNEDIVVVLLLAVIDELDNLKRSKVDAVRRSARRALKEVDALVLKPHARVTLKEAKLAEGGWIHLLVMVDSLTHVRIPAMDNEIVDRALELSSRTRARTIFLTGDTGAALRSRAAGLECRKVSTPSPGDH